MILLRLPCDITHCPASDTFFLFSNILFFGFKQHSEKEKTKSKSVSITKISFKIFFLELVQELESALLSKRNKNSWELFYSALKRSPRLSLGTGEKEDASAPRTKV